MKITRVLVASALLALASAGAHADLTIGVSLPLTGPAAGLGIPCKTAFALWPDAIAGEKLRLIILDDASDSTAANKNGRRFVTEDKVDVIIGSASVPLAIAISAIAEETRTVQLAAAPIDLPPGKGAWTFRLPQSTAVMAAGIVEHMKKLGVKSFGFLGYSDPYGQSWLNDISKQAQEAGIKLTTAERFARADTSVTAQAIKVIATNPDAVLVVASGSGAAMPHTTLVERGYKGRIFQTHSAASNDLMCVGGKLVEGGFVISGPAVVPEQLPDSHPSKKVALAFVQQYEKMYGAGSRNQFAAHINDALVILQRVVPVALKKGKAGTAEFRAALKDALENSGSIVVSQGVFRYTAKDHFGLDGNARVMLTVQNGGWKLLP